MDALEAINCHKNKAFITLEEFAVGTRFLLLLKWCRNSECNNNFYIIEKIIIAV